MSRRTPCPELYPETVRALALQIEAAPLLTRGHLAAAVASAGIDLPINLSAGDTDGRRQLSPRQAASKPVLRPDLIAFNDRVMPEAEVVISASGVPPHEVTLLHEDRFAYTNAAPGEQVQDPDWHKVAARHPSCTHAAWMLALLQMRAYWRPA